MPQKKSASKGLRWKHSARNEWSKQAIKLNYRKPSEKLLLESIRNWIATWLIHSRGFLLHFNLSDAIWWMFLSFLSRWSRISVESFQIFGAKETLCAHVSGGKFLILNLLMDFQPEKKERRRQSIDLWLEIFCMPKCGALLHCFRLPFSASFLFWISRSVKVIKIAKPSKSHCRRWFFLCPVCDLRESWKCAITIKLKEY